MKILILETENTLSGKHADIFKHFYIARSESQKRSVLSSFRMPTCTKDAALLAEAERIESLVTATYNA